MSMDERGSLQPHSAPADPLQRFEYRAHGGQFEVQLMPATHQRVAMYRVRFRRADGTTDVLGHMVSVPDLGHCEQMLRHHQGKSPAVTVKPARVGPVLRPEDAPRKARGTTKAARELDRFSPQYRRA